MEDRVHEGPSRSENRYQAYLVRLWQDSPNTPWRALARAAETGEECRFATIEHLFLFLHRQTEGSGSGRTSRGGGRHGASLRAGCEPERAIEEA